MITLFVLKIQFVKFFIRTKNFVEKIKQVCPQKSLFERTITSPYYFS